ncbi:hypothetical protein CsatB_015333 [Cannabis sativa]
MLLFLLLLFVSSPSIFVAQKCFSRTDDHHNHRLIITRKLGREPTGGPPPPKKAFSLGPGHK